MIEEVGQSVRIKDLITKSDEPYWKDNAVRRNR